MVAPGIWSEHSPPWDETLNVNAWVPVEFQWVCCILIWSGTLFWIFTSDLFSRKTAAGEVIYEIDRWMPPALLVPGYVIFFGFVSFSLGWYIWFNYLMNFVCMALFTYYKAAVPYLIGSFTACIFLFPVLTATRSKLVGYDYGPYSIGVAYPTGLSNAVTYLMVQHKWISPHMRWFLQSLGWTLIMSGIPIVSILMGVQLDEYKMNLLQFIRYSAFQLSVYLFIYYGLCKHLEQAAWNELPLKKRCVPICERLLTGI